MTKVHLVKLPEDLRYFRRDRTSNTLRQMNDRVPAETMVQLGPPLKSLYDGHLTDVVPFPYAEEIHYFLLEEIHIRDIRKTLSCLSD